MWVKYYEVLFTNQQLQIWRQDEILRSAYSPIFVKFDVDRTWS